MKNDNTLIYNKIALPKGQGAHLGFVKAILAELKARPEVNKLLISQTPLDIQAQYALLHGLKESGITILALPSIGLEAAMLQALSALSQLKRLDVRANELTEGDDLSPLSNIQLVEVDFSGNTLDVYSQIMPLVDQMPSLLDVHVRGCIGEEEHASVLVRALQERNFVNHTSSIRLFGKEKSQDVNKAPVTIENNEPLVTRKFGAI